MECESIEARNEFVREYIDVLPPVVREKLAVDFALRFAHESTKIEGNRLTLLEVKILLEDGYSVGGKPLRELYEVLNHHKAYRETIRWAREGRGLTHTAVQALHGVVMENIMPAGVYRNGNVRIVGASVVPPEASAVEGLMAEWLAEIEALLSEKVRGEDAIRRAARAHGAFERIHPFFDGNGRTGRLLLNFLLMRMGFLPIVIRAAESAAYYAALEAYAARGEGEALEALVLQKENEVLASVEADIRSAEDAPK